MTRAPLLAATLLASLLVARPIPGVASQPAPPLAQAGIDEHLGAQLPLDLAFVDASGRSVRLGSRFRDGKPVVLTLAYYHCSMLCPLVLRGAAALARDAAPRPGADYHLLTISIDPRDRPADGVKSRADLLHMTGAAGDDWPFWTGGAEEIAQLTDALGFRYHYDPRSDQFAHAAALFVLTSDGQISRYLYGVDFPREEFEAALSTAASGQTGSSFERIILRCFHYVPALRRYGDLVASSLRGGAIVVLLTAGGGLALLGRRVRRRRDG